MGVIHTSAATIVIFILLFSVIQCFELPKGGSLTASKSRLALLERIITNPGSFNTPLPSFFKGTEELVKKEGYHFEKYKLVTDDGYILEIHRVGPNNLYDDNNRRPFNRRPPVFLMPGFVGASDTYVLRHNSLAFMLVDAGYDVWIGNSRGTYYSKQHVSLNSTSKEFWNYSVHEVGYYDIPAFIDFVLASTGWPKLFFVGYSMGNTAFFITTSTRPEYNRKLILTIAMPPVASQVALEDINSLFTRITILTIDQIYSSLSQLNVNEVLPRASEVISLLHDLASDSRTQPYAYDLYGLLFGEHRANINKETFPVEGPHIPAGASLKQLYHQLLIIKRGFQAFDYGPEMNLVKYNNTTPPVYSLRATTSPVAIFYSDNDPYASQQSSMTVAETLPNVVYVKEMPTGYTHGDYVFGKDFAEAVNAPIIRLFDNYS